MIFNFLSKPNAQAQDNVTKSIYDMTFEKLDGGTTTLAAYKGKKILIVNTASKCGFTKQYAYLEKLYESHKNNLVIVGFPANNFLFQEPGDNQEIKQFCTKNYGVTFPMAAKISVKGKSIHPLYIWLTNKKWNSFSNNSVKWNFQKYLIDEQGKLVAVFAPNVEPMSDEILKAIQ